MMALTYEAASMHLLSELVWVVSPRTVVMLLASAGAVVVGIAIVLINDERASAHAPSVVNRRTRRWAVRPSDILLYFGAPYQPSHEAEAVPLSSLDVQGLTAETGGRTPDDPEIGGDELEEMFGAFEEVMTLEWHWSLPRAQTSPTELPRHS
ncbi:hypothetical protein [Pseudonocardia spinosispora]|uniref:hypothetical protein n=1 Tax=Pseudonocardia spinosispora TaxID=103441 RepID=UPI00048BFF22|nr:hypothetical protein [Pseudonocardia spinosispora]